MEKKITEDLLEQYKGYLYEQEKSRATTYAYMKLPDTIKINISNMVY